MGLRLLDRISTLLKADVHSVVDALEERPLLLRQHLREAELDVLAKRARSQALAEEENRLRTEHARREQEARALDEDVELALANGKDELARFALKRLLPLRRELTGLSARIAEVAKARESLAALLERQEAELGSLRANAAAWLARPPEAFGPGGAAAAQASAAVADEEVELELLRRSGAAADAGRTR
jgi:phage shock protein A